MEHKESVESKETQNTQKNTEPKEAPKKAPPGITGIRILFK